MRDANKLYTICKQLPAPKFGVGCCVSCFEGGGAKCDFPQISIYIAPRDDVRCVLYLCGIDVRICDAEGGRRHPQALGPAKPLPTDRLTRLTEPTHSVYISYVMSQERIYSVGWMAFRLRQIYIRGAGRFP